jgi:hypothetical protein
MANTNCCGGTSTTTTCDSTIAELPRYYPRQLITPDDLTLEQNYFRDRMRRHNRLLHGWGVVCGAQVCAATTTNSDGSTSFTPWQVKVQTGYILGPYGDEIIIDCCRTVDLRTSGVSGVTGQPCVDAPDPWCSQVVTTSTNTTFYIGVQYKQCMMRPVRVQPVGCGCNDNTCEYSRWHDGYEIGVLTTQPCQCTGTNLIASLQELSVSPLPTCPDCSCGPWVCLATITVSADGLGTIQSIDNCTCRRMVLSLSSFCWVPQCASVTSVTGAQTPPQVLNNATPVTITVNGSGFQAGVVCSFGQGITVIVNSVTATALDLTVSAASTVQPGFYNLSINNAACPFPGAIQVVQASPASATGSSPAAASATGAGGAAAKQAPPKAAAKRASQASSDTDKTASKGGAKS